MNSAETLHCPHCRRNTIPSESLYPKEKFCSVCGHDYMGRDEGYYHALNSDDGVNSAAWQPFIPVGRGPTRCIPDWPLATFFVIVWRVVTWIPYELGSVLRAAPKKPPRDT